MIVGLFVVLIGLLLIVAKFAPTDHHQIRWDDVEFVSIPSPSLNWPEQLIETQLASAYIAAMMGVPPELLEDKLTASMQSYLQASELLE